MTFACKNKQKINWRLVIPRDFLLNPVNRLYLKWIQVILSNKVLVKTLKHLWCISFSCFMLPTTSKCRKPESNVRTKREKIVKMGLLHRQMQTKLEQRRRKLFDIGCSIYIYASFFVSFWPIFKILFSFESLWIL